MASTEEHCIAACDGMEWKKGFQLTNWVFTLSRIAWRGRYLGFFDIPALIHNWLRFILSKWGIKRNRTSVSWHAMTRNSASECTQCRIIRVFPSSWKPLSSLISMFGRKHLTVFSSLNPTPNMLTRTWQRYWAIFNKSSNGCVTSWRRNSSCALWLTFPSICRMLHQYDRRSFEKQKQLSQVNES